MTTLKEAKKIKTNTYKVTNDVYKDFYIDIVDKDDMFDVFLYHNNIGIKDYMFGWPKYQSCDNSHYTLDDMIEMVAGNLETQSYIPDYINDYMMD